MNYKSYYDILLGGMPEGLTVSRIVDGLSWKGAELSDGSFGIAMNTEGESVKRLYPTLVGLSVKAAAEAVTSWNMQEASEAMAVINAVYNTPQRMEKLNAGIPYTRRCTSGYETRDKKIALVGHLRFDETVISGEKELYILERDPKSGDYPDSACEYILPDCDMVIVTGSAAINKTMPRLLELSKNAVTIVVGPSVPMCPGLMSLGIDRLSGLCVTDREGLIDWMLRERGNPYRFGETFML